MDGRKSVNIFYFSFLIPRKAKLLFQSNSLPSTNLKFLNYIFNISYGVLTISVVFLSSQFFTYQAENIIFIKYKLKGSLAENCSHSHYAIFIFDKVFFQFAFLVEHCSLKAFFKNLRRLLKFRDERQTVFSDILLGKCLLFLN